MVEGERGEGLPVHVYPVNDYEPHVLAAWSCWCKPISDPESPEVVVHRSMVEEPHA
jgi:hypothetical protein